MRINTLLNESLVEEAMRCADVKSRQELVDLALREFIAARRCGNVSELFGKVEIDPEYNYKTLRRA